MATQLENEVFSLHHRQKLMETAQTSRALNKMRKSSSGAKPGFSLISSWVRRKAIKIEFGSEFQTTQKTGNEKNLISG
jgi:hypothetical protein